mgnify:CR=1 FL=1
MNMQDIKGSFQRKESLFRNWITKDGEFAPEKGRYHLYVSLACPWANRTLIMRNLKGLQDFVSVSTVHWRMGKESWHFEKDQDSDEEPLFNAKFLYELYRKVDPNYEENGGVVTVPLLWDKKTNTVVSNESAEIIRMFNSAFDDVGALQGDYYPETLRTEIDAMNDRFYHSINNGVYRCGFAKSQEAYNQAYEELFDALDYLETHLQDKHYLVGNQLTEADIRLFVTLIRFDAVYYSHFKCNKKQLRGYPEIWRYLRELYAKTEFAETINFYHIKHHYYESHPSLNPSGIVPIGPEIDFSL